MVSVSKPFGPWSWLNTFTARSYGINTSFHAVGQQHWRRVHQIEATGRKALEHAGHHHRGIDTGVAHPGIGHETVGRDRTVRVTRGADLVLVHEPGERSGLRGHHLEHRVDDEALVLGLVDEVTRGSRRTASRRCSTGTWAQPRRSPGSPVLEQLLVGVAPSRRSRVRTR